MTQHCRVCHRCSTCSVRIHATPTICESLRKSLPCAPVSGKALMSVAIELKTDFRSHSGRLFKQFGLGRKRSHSFVVSMRIIISFDWNGRFSCLSVVIQIAVLRAGQLHDILEPSQKAKIEKGPAASDTIRRTGPAAGSPQITCPALQLAILASKFLHHPPLRFRARMAQRAARATANPLRHLDMPEWIAAPPAPE